MKGYLKRAFRRDDFPTLETPNTANSMNDGDTCLRGIGSSLSASTVARTSLWVHSHSRETLVAPRKERDEFRKRGCMNRLGASGLMRFRKAAVVARIIIII